MSPCSLALCMQLTVICFSVNMVFCQMMLCGCSVKEWNRMEKARKKIEGSEIYRDLWVLNKMPHILSCTARRVSAEGREGMWACACETQSAQEGWRERADGGEGEVRVRKRWHHWENAELDSMDTGWERSSPTVCHLSLSSFFPSLSFEMYSAGRVPIPTRLVNGRGVEYFKLHFPPFFFSPLPVLPPLCLPFHFFSCLVVH